MEDDLLKESAILFYKMISNISPEEWKDGYVIPLPVKFPKKLVDYLEKLQKENSGLNMIEFYESTCEDLMTRGCAFEHLRMMTLKFLPFVDRSKLSTEDALMLEMVIDSLEEIDTKMKEGGDITQRNT